MVDYPFTRVEVRLTTGDVIKGQWLAAGASYITLKTEDGALFFLPYTSILYIKSVEVKTEQVEVKT